MYNVTITERSRELSMEEEFMVESFSDGVKIKENMEVLVRGWAKVHVENDKSDSKEYDEFVILTGFSVAFTSSEAFEQGLRQIEGKMESKGISGKPYRIRVTAKQSKKNKSRSFILPMFCGFLGETAQPADVLGNDFPF